MREVLVRAVKNLIWVAGACLMLGTWFGGWVERNRVYNDCRFTGVTRMGEAAFKCEQFSKVVLLTPDEVADKQKEKPKK